MIDKLNARSILFVADATAFGGAERYLEDVVGYFSQSRQVELLLLGDGCPELERRMHDLSINVIRSRGGVRYWWSVYKVILAHRTWLIHVNLTHYDSCRLLSLLIGIFPRTVFIATIHLLVYIDPPKDAATKLKQYLKSLFFNKYDQLIAPSNFIAARLTDVCMYPQRKVVVIHNGVKPVSHSAAFDNDTFKIAALGRLDEAKGYQYLIEALGELVAQKVNVECTIAGDGPYRPQLERLITNLKLESRVKLIGFTKDIANVLDKKDVFVLPSLGENFPLTILEAMSAGMPIVASKVGGIPEQVVDGQNGYLVLPADVPALAAALLRLINNRSELTTFGEKSKDIYNKYFALDIMLNKVDLLYRKFA